jgi:hypothetical protein
MGSTNQLVVDPSQFARLGSKEIFRTMLNYLSNIPLALQRRFALLRRFEYYYDLSRESLKFPSYTSWRMLPEGDRHEKDYSISVAFDSSATG